MNAPNLLPDFINILSQSLPESDVKALMDSMQNTPETCVRVNPGKNTQIHPKYFKKSLPWCKDAHILNQRPNFGADPAFHIGKYYVQEASSSIIGFVIEHLRQKIKYPVTVLDLCAAPGGKSTHIASALRQDDLLIANEVIQSRTLVLSENLSKWGYCNHIITNADARQFGSSDLQFDIILADMPCSGEGLFRKDPDAVKSWSMEHVRHCVYRQERIATDIWPSLKSGGFLIYSTCTFNKFENEENVSKICRELNGVTIDLQIPESWGIQCLSHGQYRLLPHKQIGEGLFFSVIQKMDTSLSGIKTINNRKWTLRKDDTFQPGSIIIENNQQTYLVKNNNEDLIFQTLNNLPRVYLPGTPIGKILNKRKGIVFKPETALSLISNIELRFPKIEIPENEIIPFLQRQSLKNPDELQGLYLAKWNNNNLGFLNGVNKQWNNLWPMEWRLRTSNIQRWETIISR